ncbi:MAG: Gx transporter family protein [Clostridia bacterium]|nr:Gx transporter family protein [Clostridia bacterium]MBQ8758202.1 Gx transporter family protein [Clostridia bacterium]
MQDRKLRLRKMSLCAVFLAASVIISFVESMSGINGFIPLPGVRLGFCNIAVMACLFLVSSTGAFAIAVIRPLFLFLFSGNPVSLAMSFCGGMLSFLSLVVTKKLYGRVLSFAGISCISAVFHSIGQLAAAMMLMSDVSLVCYLPVFVAASSVAGSVSGSVMNIIMPRLSKIQITEVQ